MATQTSSREIPETVTRVTKEGRTLIYQLTVIQQPERARACGSGAKSSADRRPVDPPPVVELRIFEDEVVPKNDITFSYNANFFLFATLEAARPIAHGRVPPQSTQVPVLTGMPVSGMAYLDRPALAGYFIFPDLSVRHEGRYRLSFNLYEETKDSKDADAEQSNDIPKPPPTAATPNGSFDWRLEIKSAPFTVFSAKKFPGLSESTALSRTVAEQGCRVRIRRDVRMRRRDGKGSAEFDEYDEEYRSRRTATPESIHDAYARQRSISNSSDDRQPFASEPQNRPSVPGYSQQAHSGNYLAFGNSVSQHHGQQFRPPPPPPAQSQKSYQPSPYGPSASAANFNHPERQQPHYPNQYAVQRDNHDIDHSRASLSYPPAIPATSNQYHHAEQHYNRPSFSQYLPPPHTPANQHPTLAPLRIPMEPKCENLSSAGPHMSTHREVPPLPSPSYHEQHHLYNQYSAVAPSPAPTSAAPELARGGKRTYENAWGSVSHEPLYNGMRPTSSHQPQSSNMNPDDDDDDSTSFEGIKMQYKRADGSNQSRILPVQQ